MATREPGVIQATSGVSSSKWNTEGGLTKAQKETLERVEKNAGNLDSEVLTIVGDNGEILYQTSGNANSVTIPTDKEYLQKDAVVTHNHPGYFNTSLWGDTLATRVGSSFSQGDIIAAIDGNVKEIRAVTKGGYIFSLKRPASGWGIDKSPSWKLKLENEIKSLTFKNEDRYAYNTDSKDYYIRQANRVETADRARIKILARHRTVQELADKYGWNYTRRRWKD